MSEQIETAPAPDIVDIGPPESLPATHEQMWVPLERIMTNRIQNLRGGATDPETLAKSIWEAGPGAAQHLISPPQVVEVVQTDEAGQVIHDDEGNPIAEEIHLVAGFQRIAGLHRLKALIGEHNRMVADGSISQKNEDSAYMFRNGDGVFAREIDFMYNEVPVVYREVTDLTEEVMEWAHKVNLAENTARTGLNLATEIRGICALRKTGYTQVQVAGLLGKSQATISQYEKVVSKLIPEFLDAIQAGDITLKQALAVAGQKEFFSRDGSPNKTAQKAALGKLTLDKKAAREIASKKKTRRSQREIAKFAADLSSDECYADMDTDRRQSILSVLSWLNMGCDENALVYGLATEIDLGVIPQPKEKKKAAPRKKAAPKKKAKAKAAPKRRAPKRKAAAAVEATADTTVAPDAPAPKRKLTRRKAPAPTQ